MRVTETIGADYDHTAPKTTNDNIPTALQMVLNMLPKIQKGRLEIILPDGTKKAFKGKKTGPQAHIHIHNPRLARRFLTGGRLGFTEAYLDGDWSSSDITTLFEFAIVNGDAMKETMNGKKWVRLLSKLVHRLKPNSKRGSKKNIYAHYDIGNGFYAAWLDPSMTYSSALFKNDSDTLEQAQYNKYNEIIQRLDLKPDHHLLEIGCGWGGFAEHAARTIGCKITAVTVSPAQFDYATARIKSAGLEDKIDIRLQDYRDIEGQFDRIASIEMFEAVGEKYWPTFFGQIDTLLKSGGAAVLQIITIKDNDFSSYRKSADFIQRYIFPGGMLPSKSALNDQITTAGLTNGGRSCFGQDYARTLNLWNKEFQSTWSDIQTSENLDDRFKRLWEQYFAYCEAGFKAGSIDVIHQTIQKP